MHADERFQRCKRLFSSMASGACDADKQLVDQVRLYLDERQNISLHNVRVALAGLCVHDFPLRVFAVCKCVNPGAAGLLNVSLADERRVVEALRKVAHSDVARDDRVHFLPGAMILRVLLLLDVVTKPDDARALVDLVRCCIFFYERFKLCVLITFQLFCLAASLSAVMSLSFGRTCVTKLALQVATTTAPCGAIVANNSAGRFMALGVPS